MKNLSKYSLVLLLGLYGCEKSLDLAIPPGTFTSDNVFQDDALALAAVRGMYGTMTSLTSSARPFQTSLTSTFSLTSDELVRKTYAPDENLLFTNNASPAQVIVGRLWTAYYNYIYQANMILENAERSTSLSPDLRTSIMAEARFVRAFSFFYLTNIYGDVPLTLTTDYSENSLLAATPQAEVYKQIVEDLLIAQENLLGNSTDAGSRQRPSKWSASALLARVYLYQKDWEAAERTATSVINQESIYTLEAPENVFLTTSKEALWAIENYGGQLYTPDASTIQGPANNNSAFLLSDYTLSRFDANDLRRTRWTKTVGGTTASFKFKNYPSGSSGKPEALMVLRLAEQYLIRAEARAMQNNLSEAIKDVDVIRTRAGAVSDNNGANSTNTFKTVAFSNPGISRDDLIKLIYDERLRELFAEFGHRWFDVKRSPAGFVNSFEGRKPGITETDAYFPIPESEIRLNKNIKQNEGY